MKMPLSLLLIGLFLWSSVQAQSARTPVDAAKTIQQTTSPGSAENNRAKSSSAADKSQAVVTEADQPPKREIKVPAGTSLEIEAAATIDSFQVQRGELLSFRTLVPVLVDGEVVVDKGALVTAVVIEAKRGGHWGRAGRLSWIMRDVIAVDGTRLPIQIGDPRAALSQTNSTNDKTNAAARETRTSVEGDSHAGEVAVKTAVTGALLAPLFPIAPLALMSGFRRGDNAVLPEHKRFVVFINRDSIVKVSVSAN